MQCHEEQGGFFFKKKKAFNIRTFLEKKYCNFTHNKEYNHSHLSY